MRPPTSRRFRAVAIHLLASLTAAALAGVVIFFLWYPSPYAALAGGTSLFIPLVGVDAVLGPVITGVIANPAKPWTELRRDLALIVVIQLGAFGYGLYVIASSRPVYIAYEVDLFRVVRANDIEPASLADAPASLRNLSWTGPRPIGVVKPTDPAEQFRSIELGFAGVQLATQPRYWRDYESLSDAAWRTARPIAKLVDKYPQAQPDVADIARKAGTPVEGLRFLPLLSGRESWVVALAEPGARIVGYLPLDGFF